MTYLFFIILWQMKCLHSKCAHSQDRRQHGTDPWNNHREVSNLLCSSRYRAMSSYLDKWWCFTCTFCHHPSASSYQRLVQSSFHLCRYCRIHSCSFVAWLHLPRQASSPRSWLCSSSSWCVLLVYPSAFELSHASTAMLVSPHPRRLMGVMLSSKSTASLKYKSQVC